MCKMIVYMSYLYSRPLWYGDFSIKQHKQLEDSPILLLFNVYNFIFWASAPIRSDEGLTLPTSA